jgi:hypothetical protein
MQFSNFSSTVNFPLLSPCLLFRVLLPLLLLITRKCCNPPAYFCPLVCVRLPLLRTRNCLERILSLLLIAAERTWACNKYISRDRHPASLLARLSDLQKKTGSSIVARWTMFTELLPGNALIISVKLNSNKYINASSTTLNKYMLLSSEARNTMFASLSKNRSD